MDNVRVYSKEERMLRKQLGELICRVRMFEKQVDTLFAADSPVQGVERGRELAKHLNALTFANDQALYFGLHFDHNKDANGKGANIQAILKHAARTKEIKRA